MPNEMNGKPPSFAFGVNAPQTPPRRLPRRGGAPRRTPVRSRARVGRSWVSVRSGTRLCASRIVGIAEIGLRRGFRGILSRDRASRRTSSSAMTSSAGAASAFDLLARGILKGGGDLCVRTRRATGCGSAVRSFTSWSERNFTSHILSYNYALGQCDWVSPRTATRLPLVFGPLDTHSFFECAGMDCPFGG